MKIKWEYEYATGSRLTQISDVIGRQGDYYTVTFTRPDNSQTTTGVHRSQIVAYIDDWQPRDVLTMTEAECIARLAADGYQRDENGSFGGFPVRGVMEVVVHKNQLTDGYAFAIQNTASGRAYYKYLLTPDFEQFRAEFARLLSLPDEALRATLFPNDDLTDAHE